MKNVIFSKIVLTVNGDIYSVLLVNKLCMNLKYIFLTIKYGALCFENFVF